MTDDWAAWLAQVVEEAIEPDLPICDPHHHLWDRDGYRYLIHELLDDLNSGHNVVSTVFVECRSMYRAGGPEPLRPIGESEFVNGVGAMSASGDYGETRICAGIVGFADLSLGAAVDEVLEAHLAAAPARFRGIRRSAGFDVDERVINSHPEPPQGLYADPAFRQGFARLAHYDLSFEGWCYHRQIPELTALARAHPENRIVLDHFGGPLGIGPYKGKREEIFAQWKPDIAELAECPNVFAKLGGINMPVNGFGWHKRERPPASQELATATADWYHHAIDCFGPARCMFESNFPVDKRSCSYGVLWNAFKRIAERYSEAEKAALFHDTAAAFYRLAG